MPIAIVLVRSVAAYLLGCAVAVRTLSSIVKANMPTTTPREKSTGIL
jgi:hypothetical protein